MGNVVQCSQIDTLKLCVHDASTVKNHYPIVGLERQPVGRPPVL